MDRKGWAALALAVAGLIPGAALSDPEPPAPLDEANAGAPAALQRCGECHMVYPSRMLPARSWTAILSQMGDHFGKSAAITETDLGAIRAYLTSNAADSPNASAQDRQFMSGLLPDSAPLRITATPWWSQMHADFASYSEKSRKPIAPADCLGCHRESGR
jgi:hypothetical protein